MNKLTAAVGMLLLIVIAVALLAAACGGDDAPETAAEVLEKAFESLKTPVYQPVVARVNGSEIAGARVQFSVAFGIESQVPDIEAAGLDERSVLNFYIGVEINYQEAARRGLLCTEDEVRDLIERQITSIPEIADVWAAHLGVTSDQIDRQPEIVSLYSRFCAGTALGLAVAREEGFDHRTKEFRLFYREFLQSLRANADIEILDPRLQ